MSDSSITQPSLSIWPYGSQCPLGTRLCRPRLFAGHSCRPLPIIDRARTVVRASGKRTLAKLNAFDLVVTVALGSTLATILLSRELSLAEGAAALALLVVLQFVATWLSVRWAPLRAALKSAPTLVVRDGELLRDVMRRQRVTDNEIYQAVRAEGLGDLRDVAAVVLETDGTFSVIPAPRRGSGSTLRDVADAVPEPR